MNNLDISSLIKKEIVVVTDNTEISLHLLDIINHIEEFIGQKPIIITDTTLKSFPLPSILLIEDGKIFKKLDGLEISTADIILFHWNQFRHKQHAKVRQDIITKKSFTAKNIKDRLEERAIERQDLKYETQMGKRADDYFFDRNDGVIKFNIDDKQGEENYLIVE